MRRVQLIRKLGLSLNGLDLSGFRIGDLLLLREADAWMLVAEGWAQPVAEPPPEGIQSRPARPEPT